MSGKTPRERQANPFALPEVRERLSGRSGRRDLPIENLDMARDRAGYLSATRLSEMAQEMCLAQTEVHEVATFYPLLSCRDAG